MELAKKCLLNLFPSRCLLCQKTIISRSERESDEKIEICHKCLTALSYNKIFCNRCAVPLVAEGSGSVYCGRCIKKSPAFDYVYSPLCYENDVVRLVHQLKFNKKITFARTLGEMMLDCWLSKIEEKNSGDVREKIDCLLPVPLHRSRMQQRGFNQSIELSRVISKKLNVPIECSAVSRMRSTESQSGLSFTQRRKNIKGAFEIVQKISASHVLIVDDVMTTGSTVDELAHVLKQQGVKQVGVLCLARAPIKN